jgi:hypothetical protein
MIIINNEIVVTPVALLSQKNSAFITSSALRTLKSSISVNLGAQVVSLPDTWLQTLGPLVVSSQSVKNVVSGGSNDC